MSSRSKDKGNTAIAETLAKAPNVKVTLVQMNLASFASVQAAAKQLLATTQRLDILMNNAGIMAVPAQLTVEDYEIQFGTNHMGHALLIRLLLPMMLKTAQRPNSDVRIINLSDSHKGAAEEGISFDNLRSSDYSKTALMRCSQSKLANILYSEALARRYPEITTVAIHPGIVRTGLQNTMRKSFLLARVLAPVVLFTTRCKSRKGL